METPKSTKDWIVFFIKYASAVTLLIGALWNYGEIIYSGITGTSSASRLFEQKQLELWMKNKECLIQQPERFETDKRELIELLLCQKTATILITVIPPDVNKRTSTWVELIREDKNAGVFELNAQVKKVNQGSVTVEMCRYMQNNTFNIIRKVDNRCVKEVKRLDTGEDYKVVIDCRTACNG
jgi:hypothetical protein